MESVADILCSFTPKSNEKLFYGHTYILTTNTRKRRFSLKLIDSKKKKKTEIVVKNYINSIRIYKDILLTTLRVVKYSKNYFVMSFICKEVFKANSDMSCLNRRKMLKLQISTFELAMAFQEYL